MTSGAFPIDEAQLVALYLQCIFYGFTLITVGYGMRVLLWTHDGHLKKWNEVNLVMVLVTVLMFTIATMEMGFGLQHNLDAFIYYHGPGGPAASLSEISDWVNIIHTADYVMQTSIGDAIMVYRCYVVCDRNWKVALLPGLLWLAETAFGWAVVGIESTLHTKTLLDDPRLVPFVTGVLAATMVLTTMTTGMIVYRIAKINSRVVSSNMTRVSGGSRKLTRVVRILIESGTMYTLSVVIFFITYLAGHNSQYGVADCVVQLIPISFTLILIRVDRGIAVQSQSTSHWRSTDRVALSNLPSPIFVSQTTEVSNDQDPKYLTTTNDTMSDSDAWKSREPIA